MKKGINPPSRRVGTMAVLVAQASRLCRRLGSTGVSPVPQAWDHRRGRLCHRVGAQRAQNGLGLIEVAVALGLAAVLLPVILQALMALINHGDFAYDRSILMERAQSALESVQSQAYQDDASQYTAVTVPDGYGISISGETPVTYVYPSPASTPTPQTLQKIIITITGVRGNLTLEAYKVKR